MPRKSVRIQTRRQHRSPVDEQEIIETATGKRKAEDELEHTECSNGLQRRREQYKQQNEWLPISSTSSTVTSCAVVPDIPSDDDYDAGVKCTAVMVTSPHGDSDASAGGISFGETFRLQNRFTVPIRNSPLPSFQWADSSEVWETMILKEKHYVRNPNVLDRHPSIQPKMRAILLDWLIEVCEVYRLHRESFYLAIDFIDRYLCITRNIRKQQLQLIGITCLFVAAKLEEIYPPKLTEFAYVTDGACTEEELLDQELLILKALGWDLSPLTTNSWLNIFLQLANIDNIEEKEQNFVFPQYSQHAFIQVARLLDLCFLDIGCLQFTYSLLATSALYHMSSEQMALSVSGYQWEDVALCVQWMSPFAITLREAGVTQLKYFPAIASDASHNIQTHTVDLTLLEAAQKRQIEVITSSRASPDLHRQLPSIITPPSTKGKVKVTPQIIVIPHTPDELNT